MSDKLVTEVVAHTTVLTFMPSVGFEPAVLAVERPQSYALDHMSIWISMLQLICEKNSNDDAVFHVISHTKFHTHSPFSPGNMASVKVE